MTIQATNRYMNWSSVGFTPSGGSSTPITGVKSVRLNHGVSTKKESADYDAFPTVSVMDFQDPTVTIRTIDAFALNAVGPGVKGTLVATFRDAYNAATTGGGAKTITLSNSQIQDMDSGGEHREFGDRNLTLGAVSVDGSTSPLAIAAV